MKENVHHADDSLALFWILYNANNVVVLLCQLNDGFNTRSIVLEWRLILMKLVQRGFYLPFG